MHPSAKTGVSESSNLQPAHVVQGPADENEIEEFLKGNKLAAAKVYARAACFLSNGVLPPEPLLSVISERLQSIGSALQDSSKQDKQRVIYAAVLPVQTRGRPPKKSALVRLLIEEIADLTRHLKGKARRTMIENHAKLREKEFKGRTGQPIRAKNLIVGVDQHKKNS